jgi:hypothetical protein
MFKLALAALVAAALPHSASADYISDVQGAVVVLEDLPAPFASTFCSTFVKSVMATATAPPPGIGGGAAAGVPYNGKR